MTFIVERALEILSPQELALNDSEQGRLPGNRNTSAGVATDDPKGIPGQLNRRRTWVLILLRTLTFRTRLLMQILPTIQQILTTAELAECQKANDTPISFHVSENARQWVRQIFDKFENADKRLAERLGQANAQRYDEIRKLNSQTDPSSIDQAVGSAEGPTKSLFRPPTTFHDSGVGTSILTPAEIAASVASHSSFAQSLAESSSRRVPKTPKAVVSGRKRFECAICGNMVSGIKNRTQWK